MFSIDKPLIPALGICIIFSMLKTAFLMIVKILIGTFLTTASGRAFDEIIEKKFDDQDEKPLRKIALPICEVKNLLNLLNRQTIT